MSRTLYLEADEDITSAIDKIGKIEEHEIRVVVPKRSGLLSSIINLKLLKKATHDAKKKLILVTTDDTVINLASRVGLPVAENLNADAEVPKVDDLPAVSQADVIEEGDPEPEPTLPAETLSEEPAEPAFARKELSKEDPKDAPKKPKKGSKIPDFNSLQKKILLGGAVAAALLLIFGLNFYFKKADITVFAKGAMFPTDISFRAVPESGNPEAGTVGSNLLSKNEQLSGDANSTGKKDVGTKSSGSVTVTNYCYNPGTIPAGTVFTASNGKRFVSTAAVAVPNAVPSGGSCPSPTTASAPVTASENGDTYNLAPTSYTVGSLPSSGNINSVRGQGGQMSGGTSKVIAVVTQADVDAALKKLVAEKSGVKEELMKKAGSDQVVVESTLSSKINSQTASPGVGEEGSSFSIKADVDFTIRVLSKDDLEKLIKNEIESKIGSENQIYDTGIGSAKIAPGDSSEQFKLLANVYAGPKMDVEAMKKTIKGKKLGEASSELGKIQGVERTEIELWPFWVSRVTRLGNRINIDIKVESPQ